MKLCENKHPFKKDRFKNVNMPTFMHTFRLLLIFYFSYSKFPPFRLSKMIWKEMQANSTFQEIHWNTGGIISAQSLHFWPNLR